MRKSTPTSDILTQQKKAFYHPYTFSVLLEHVKEEILNIQKNEVPTRHFWYSNYEDRLNEGVADMVNDLNQPKMCCLSDATHQYKMGKSDYSLLKM